MQEETSSGSGSTIRQLPPRPRRPPSTAAILSRAIQDFETDFNAWDSSYKLHVLPTLHPRPGREGVRRLGGVYAYNPHFEPGTTFPRRMSRVATVVEVDGTISSRTFIESSEDITTDSVGEGKENIGYLEKIKRTVLRKIKGGKEG
ncbi:hypothetical protein TWF481_000107 [Arthrobotrys musiformis]|uniref:Uncharacterized protein n=1 Tax=Arthrobotrys musiformis TaxID=47236 RepID=A0AAV9WLL7_9PEZI